MLIRSQNKKFLINLNNSFGIEIVDCNENEFKIVFSDSCNDYSAGCYSSEEKAIKVLDMMQEAYVNRHIDFQMPADSEVVV